MPQELRRYSREQALGRLQNLCARAERSSGDALRLMRRWGLTEAESSGVLKSLKADRFIDDERYAAAYVRDRMRFSGWGVLKIRAGLRAKGIAAETIDRACANECGESNNLSRLEELLRHKAPTIKAKDAYDLRAKLVRFGLSRGFTYDEVFDAVDYLKE